MEKVFESEYRFLCILWENEPVSSPKLVELCAQKFGWKKSTTYTMIKKLSQKGLIVSEAAIVKSLVSKQEVDWQAGNELLQRGFQGNVPAFLTAFMKNRKLSQKDVTYLTELIQKAAGEDE